MADFHTAVDNNSNSPGVFTTIQAAQDAALSGDTLFIHNSPTQYASTNITKQLVIIGEGALPDKFYKYKTDIYSLSFGFNQNYTSNASGSKLFGCSVYSVSLLSGGGTGTVPVNNITIQRNSILNLSFSNGNGTTTGHSGILISNNILGTVGGGNGGLIENTIIRNNFISSAINLGNATAGNWTFSNNIVFNSFSNIYSALVSNNIFYRPYAFDALDTYYSTISNNLFYQADGTATPYVPSDIVSGTNSGSNNILNQDPLFIYPLLYNDLSSYSYIYPGNADPTANYHLRPNSPCLAAGTDGGELGIYGGLIPFFEGTPSNSRFTYFPMPSIPAVLDMNIQNSSVLPNGSLNVQFIGRKQD